MAIEPTPSSNAFHYPAYLKYFISRVGHSFALQIISTAIGWQIYAITHDPIYLAYVGLAVFLPVLLLVIPSGYVADHFNRRWVSAICFCVEALAALGLVVFTLGAQTHVWPVFAYLAMLGVASAFGNPAASAIVPNLLSKEALPHGISLNSVAWQTSSITGPVIGGLLYSLGAVVPYAVSLVMLGMGMLALVAMGHVNQHKNEQSEGGLQTLLAGFSFIWSEPIVLGAISLDLFAVLLGGAVAMMPVYASDILHLDSVGLGLLRSAPGVGAILVGLWLAKFGIKDRAGLILFIAVAFSGLVVVVFGYSVWPWLSILALGLYGAFDMISVYVRETLMQLWIPDAVRGRVNAVNNVFIGASNQLGEARAGFMAALIGAVPAVVLGGFGTIAVAGLWAVMFPKLRKANRLNEKEVL
ncbi:MAG: MFS transporter [Alphaproteobacteria bacterium]|nr:MFS transporter [Alphaproteobacteria bacterium]